MSSTQTIFDSLTPENRWLLQAAVRSDDIAVKAWTQWRTQVDIETLDDESHHVLSTLYTNLVCHQIDDAHLARLKGVHKHTWYSNQLLLRRFRNSLKHLKQACIQPIVRGDLALLATCYKDYGDRYVGCFEIQVSPKDVLVAWRILQQTGWSTHTPGTEADGTISPMVFRTESYFKLMLHSHLFKAQPSDHSQASARAVSVDINGIVTQALCLIDQLLALIKIINQSDSAQPLYVLVDAAMLVKQIDTADLGSQLFVQAQHHDLHQPLQHFLDQLYALFNIPLRSM